MKDQIESWIRVGDETYEDCLVGNRKGLEALKNAIDASFESESNSSELADYTNADFDFVVLAQDHEIEQEKESFDTKLMRYFIGTLVLFWLVILPVLGIYGLIKILKN